jgi:adenylate kinase
VFDNVLSIEISDNEIIDRMGGRRACTACGATYHVVSAPSKVEGKCDKCGADLVLRDDDKPETVKNRLAVYHTETEPLKDFYAQRGNLKAVDNQPTIEATTQVVLRALGI